MILIYRPWHSAANENGMVDRALVSDEVAMSALPFPMVISDQIEVKSMVDGKTYTSKSGLRRSYRQNGYIELGNEQQKPAPKPKPDRKAIRNSLGKAFNRAGISL